MRDFVDEAFVVIYTKAPVLTCAGLAAALSIDQGDLALSRSHIPGALLQSGNVIESLDVRARPAAGAMAELAARSARSGRLVRAQEAERDLLGLPSEQE